MTWPIILTGILLLCAIVIAILLADAPPLDPNDPDGLSDAERDELAATHHEPGRWE